MRLIPRTGEDRMRVADALAPWCEANRPNPMVMVDPKRDLATGKTTDGT